MRLGQATVDEDGEGFADEDFAIDIPVRPRSGRASCVRNVLKRPTSGGAPCCRARRAWCRACLLYLPCACCRTCRPETPVVAACGPRLSLLLHVCLDARHQGAPGATT